MFSRFMDFERVGWLIKIPWRLKYCFIILCINLILFSSTGPAFGQSAIPIVESGVEAFLSGDYGVSLGHYFNYLKSHDQLQDQQRHALLLRLAYIAAWAGQTNYALAFLKDGDELEAAGLIPDSTSRADRFLLQAIFAYNQNRFTEAADSILASLPFRIVGDKFEESILANSYGFLGVTYKFLEDYATAIRYYDEAIRIDRVLNRPFVMANELTERASSRMAIDPFDPEIETDLEEALQIYRSLNNFRWQAYVNNEYCILFQKRKNTPKALEYILETARIEESIQDEVNLDVTYNNIGALYENMNKIDSSINYIRKAINTAKNQGKSTKGEYLSNLGTLFGKSGHLDSALLYYEKAIQQLMPNSLPGDSVTTFYSMVYPQLPGYFAGKANAFYESFHNNGKLDDLRQSIISYDIALHQLDTLRSLYSFENKANAVKDNRKYYFLALQSAAEYFEQTGDTTDLETAFLLASRSKALVFDEYLRVNEARVFLDINPDLIRRDDSLKMKKAAILQKVYEYDSPQSNNDSISKYKSLLFETDEALGVLNREIKTRNPAYYQSVHTQRAFPSDLIRSRLSENELILDYTWHKNQIIVMAIGSDDFSMHHFEAPEDLREILGTYRNFLEDQPNQLTYREFKEHSMFLYKVLMEPFESLISDKDLYIIADDSLALLPFETLLFEAPIESIADYAKLPFLLKKNPISYYHSIQQFVLNTEKSPIYSSGVSAFAPFDKLDYNDGTEHLNRLIGSAEEVKAIKKYFPTLIYRGRSASEARFRTALSQPKIVHIATHGLQADSTPLENHLLFYPKKNNQDFKFHLFELLGMQINSPLVVLSSCNTGSGTLQPGEGVLSLARAFHFAGTPALVMSQWPVDDAVAAIIMNEFYGNLKKGLPLNRAIQQAKLTYLDGAGKVRSKPFYWASFQLTGYSGSIVVEESTNFRWGFPVLAISLLLLIIILTVRLYKRRKAL